MIQAIKHFHPYLYGRRFTVRTDHAALKWLLNFKHQEGQLARWLELLQTNDFDIEHRPGRNHSNADALSRRPCPSSCSHCSSQELKEDRATTEQNPKIVRQVNNTIITEQTALQWTDEEVKRAQRNDVHIKHICQWLEKDSTKPPWAEIAPFSAKTKAYWAQWPNLKLCNGLLYRVWATPRKSEDVKQLILPASLRKEAIKYLHDLPSSGHFASDKTLNRVRERFYWVGYTQDVKRYCESCDLCASCKGLPRKPRRPMKQYNVGAPMERIAVDVLGPLPLSDSGNKYLVIASDYFTKWPEAYPIPNQEAMTIAKCLVEEFFSRFGVPLEIHSDQGRNFESSLFQEMCKLLQVRKTRTTPLHPQSDGMVERMNLGSTISKVRGRAPNRLGQLHPSAYDVLSECCT